MIRIPFYFMNMNWFSFLIMLIAFFDSYGRNHTECCESIEWSKSTNWMFYHLRQWTGLCKLYLIELKILVL